MTDALGLVRGALREVAPETDFARLRGDADLREELGLDSMDYLRFATKLAAALAIDIPERDMRQLATLDGAVRYVEFTRDRDATASRSPSSTPR